MARGPRYSVPPRRRREGKTNYKMRRSLIISRKPRFVVRGSLKHIIVQIVEADIIGDKVTTFAHSKELVKDYGWKGGCGNLPAAYLTGLLCGQRATAKGLKEAVLDIGLRSPSKGSRVFAALKGFIDAGITVPHDEEILPEEERIKGQHIANYAAEMVSSDKELYSRMFSRYLAVSLSPQMIPEHFADVKEKIISSFKR